jgi:hypothetical protein
LCLAREVSLNPLFDFIYFGNMANFKLARSLIKKPTQPPKWI